MERERGLDYQVLFEKAPPLIMVLDPGLIIRAVSDAYAAATLVKRDEVVGRHLFEVFPDNPDDADADGVGSLGASLRRVLHRRLPDTMGVQQYDVEDPATPGVFRAKYWNPVNTPVLSSTGQVQLIVHSVEDVTDYVELEAESEANAVERAASDRAMQAAILRGSAQLRDSNAQLRAANEAKNDFLSRMSHELRTPLAAILGFSELLTLADLDHEHAEWSSTILRAGRHLLGLVNEVLDISRIESGDLAVSLEPIAIEPLLRDAYELVAPLAKARGVTLHSPVVRLGSGYIVADPQRLKQVTVNLLSNAVKYNRDDGEIHVRVEPDAPERSRISVTDTGRGMSAEALSRLFVPFERLDAAAAGIEGVGLGLALSRALVETMGGQLTATSEVGVGSTFAVDLRRGEPTAVEDIAADHHDALAPMEFSESRTLLYIEDTPANLRLVEEILKARPSIKMLPAMLGSLGLDLAREHQPDLILLDFHLPDFGGDQVLERLRADERTSHIPVVILSADATGKAVEPLLALGAHAYLTKPIGVLAFLEVIDELLGDRAGATQR